MCHNVLCTLVQTVAYTLLIRKNKTIHSQCISQACACKHCVLAFVVDMSA